MLRPRVLISFALAIRPVPSLATSHHHFLAGLILPRPTKSSSRAIHLAAAGTCIAAQRNGASRTRPARFQGQSFMQRPHIEPPRFVVR